MNADKLAKKIITLMSDPKADGHLQALITMVVDEALSQPVSSVINPEEIADTILTILASEGAHSTIRDHVPVIVERERARVEESGETLRDALPDEVIAGIAERMHRRMKLPRSFGKNIVDANFIRQLITGALTEILEAFLTRLPFGGGGSSGSSGSGGSGLLGSLARKGASRLKDAGSALSGIGAGLQETLTQQAREFAAQQADRLKQGIVDRFKAAENSEALEAMRQRALEAVLDLQIIDIHRLGDDPGLETSMEWAIATISHNLDRPEIREALRSQIMDAIGRDGSQSLADWLTAHDALESVRSQLIASGVSETARLAETKPFANWLTNLLSDALA